MTSPSLSYSPLYSGVSKQGYIYLSGLPKWLQCNSIVLWLISSASDYCHSLVAKVLFQITGNKINKGFTRRIQGVNEIRIGKQWTVLGNKTRLQFKAFWVMTPCSFVNMFQRFRRSCWMRIYCTWFLHWRRTGQTSEWSVFVYIRSEISRIQVRRVTAADNSSGNFALIDHLLTDKVPLQGTLFSISLPATFHWKHSCE